MQHGGPLPTTTTRTPMQRTHKRTTPLTDKELVAAREVESQRQRWDSDYITAAQARDMPVEVSSKPDMAARITRSQPDWPENRMSATEALGPLDPGAGESYERQERVDAASLFTGEVAGGAIPAGRKE